MSARRYPRLFLLSLGRAGQEPTLPSRRETCSREVGNAEAAPAIPRVAGVGLAGALEQQSRALQERAGRMGGPHLLQRLCTRRTSELSDRPEVQTEMGLVDTAINAGGL